MFTVLSRWLLDFLVTLCKLERHPPNYKLEKASPQSQKTKPCIMVREATRLCETKLLLNKMSFLLGVVRAQVNLRLQNSQASLCSTQTVHLYVVDLIPSQAESLRMYPFGSENAGSEMA